MRPDPVRLIVLSYTAAAGIAGAMLLAGAGPLAAGTTLWLGGAVITLLVAYRASRQVGHETDRDQRNEEADRILAEGLARWEAEARDTQPDRERSATG